MRNIIHLNCIDGIIDFGLHFKILTMNMFACRLQLWYPNPFCHASKLKQIKCQIPASTHMYFHQPFTKEAKFDFIGIT